MPCFHIVLLADPDHIVGAATGLDAANAVANFRGQHNGVTWQPLKAIPMHDTIEPEPEELTAHNPTDEGS